MAEPTTGSVEKMWQFARKFAEKSGTAFHPEPEVTEVVINGLAAHVDEFGRPRSHRMVGRDFYVCKRSVRAKPGHNRRRSTGGRHYAGEHRGDKVSSPVALPGRSSWRDDLRPFGAGSSSRKGQHSGDRGRNRSRFGGDDLQVTNHSGGRQGTGSGYRGGMAGARCTGVRDGLRSS